MSKFEPTALVYHKRGRWCTVAKITRFTDADEPILAVAWRNQAGTTNAISLPPAAIEYARKLGVQRFYLRDDRTLRMWRCPLEAFERQGWTGHDGERYQPLTALEPVPWRDWIFAKRVVHLNAEPQQAAQSNSQPRQLPLFEECAYAAG